MSRLIKGQVVALFALLTALVVTLAACGGGSSSTGGGSAGSGATVAGTVNDGVASVYPAGQQRSLLVAIADTLVEPAHAAPVVGVEVTLTCQGAESQTTTKQTTTNADGYFEFNGVDPGSCELHVLGDVIPLQVGEDSNNEVPVGGGVVRIEVTVQGNTVSGEIEDDAGSDSINSDDVSSDDDDSSADGASDDDSLDDGTSGDDDDGDDDDGDDGDDD